MLNLTKISKDEENKTCPFYKQEKVSGEISLFICTFSWLLFLCLLLAKTKECVYARHNCLTSYFLQETYTLTRTLRLNVTKVPPTFKVQYLIVFSIHIGSREEKHSIYLMFLTHTVLASRWLTHDALIVKILESNPCIHHIFSRSAVCLFL